MSTRRWSLTSVVVGLAVVLAFARAPNQKPYSTSSDYGGSPDSMQYSSLTEITTANVSQFELAWFYAVPDRKGNFGFNPLVVGEVMTTDSGTATRRARSSLNATTRARIVR